MLTEQRLTWLVQYQIVLSYSKIVSSLLSLYDLPLIFREEKNQDTIVEFIINYYHYGVFLKFSYIAFAN